MFKRVRLTNNTVEICGKDPSSESKVWSLDLSDYARYIIPIVVIGSFFVTMYWMKYSYIFRPAALFLLIGTILFYSTKHLLLLCQTLSPVFRADRETESVTWLDVSGKPKRAYYFRDFSSIELGMVKETPALQVLFHTTLNEQSKKVWYVVLIDTTGGAHSVINTTVEHEARKTADFLAEMLHRPLVDKADSRVLLEGEAGMPLWKRITSGGELPVFPEIREGDDIKVHKGEKQVCLHMVPTDKFPIEHSRKLLAFSVLTLLTGGSLILTIMLYSGKVVPGLFVFFHVAGLIALGIYTTNYFMYLKNYQETVTIDRTSLKISIQRRNTIDEVQIDLDDLLDVKLDETGGKYIALVSRDQMYYLANSLSIGGTKRSLEVIKAALVAMKIKPESISSDQSIVFGE